MINYIYLTKWHHVQFRYNFKQLHNSHDTFDHNTLQKLRHCLDTRIVRFSAESTETKWNYSGLVSLDFVSAHRLGTIFLFLLPFLRATNLNGLNSSYSSSIKKVLIFEAYSYLNNIFIKKHFLLESESNLLAK